MPTKKPRLTITLSPAVDRALTAFAEGSGATKSSFIGQVLEQSLPVLEKMAHTMQLARRATPDGLKEIQGRVSKLSAKAQQDYGKYADTVDMFIGTPVPPLPNRGGENQPTSSKVTRIRSRKP